jgi:hypothetical protein
MSDVKIRAIRKLIRRHRGPNGDVEVFDGRIQDFMIELCKIVGEEDVRTIPEDSASKPRGGGDGED